MSTPVSIALEALNIPHTQFTHAGPVESLQQAAAERNQPEEQVVRSILFRLEEGSYAMVLIGGPRQISWKALRRHFNQSRLTMATPDEVEQVTGYKIGSVSPFGLPHPLPVLVDQNLLNQPSVSIGSGVRGTAVILSTKDLMEALGQVDVGLFGA
ncbi:MAG: YbaK/EbsC family protein [Anaerolineae bacterium]|nr:YbaK/EbsC family protein [Anaerolineae bacterium]